MSRRRLKNVAVKKRKKEGNFLGKNPCNLLTFLQKEGMIILLFYAVYFLKLTVKRSTKVRR